MTQVVHTLRHVGNRRGRRGVTQVYTSSTCSTTVHCSSTLPWFTLYTCTCTVVTYRYLFFKKQSLLFSHSSFSYSLLQHTHNRFLSLSFNHTQTSLFNVSTNYDDGLFHGSFLLPPHHRNHAHPRIHHNHQPENHHP